MKAILLYEHGGVEKLELTTAPDPKPGLGQALVRVKSCALNHLDLFLRQGLPGIKLNFPHILGSDIAGVVEEVGKGASADLVGQRVTVYPCVICGNCGFCLDGEESLCRELAVIGEHTDGGYAELVSVPARNVLPLPEAVSFEEGASFPLAFTTAWRMLIRRAKIRPGETVLILGVGGGVSSAALQIAKSYGTRVLVTSGSDEKLEKAEELGADEGINYNAVDFAREVWRLTNKRGVDVVLDNVGEATWEKSLRCLRTGGRLVTCGATTGANPPANIHYIFWRQLDILGSTLGSKKDFLDVAARFWDGTFHPTIHKVYPLEQAQEAHRLLERGEQFGKIVLTL